jgi:hypothetical protein
VPTAAAGQRGRRAVERDAVRDRRGQRRGREHDFGEPAASDERGHAGPRLRRLHAGTDRPHGARDFETRHERPGGRVPRIAAPSHDVDEVQAGVGDVDGDLPRPGLGHGDIADPCRAGVRGGAIEDECAHRAIMPRRRPGRI